MRYHIWTIGCQMNTADSQRLASEFERLGYEATTKAENADVIVLNTCVVRQSAEDRVYGRLWTLKPLKERKPETVLALMGCLVGRKDDPLLPERFPFVDLFLPPSDAGKLLEFLEEREARSRAQDAAQRRLRFPDGKAPVAAYVPIIHGCDHVCAYCVIPYRRGREHSRPLPEIVAEVQSLVEQGVREVTLLGQIVDRYGFDLPDKPDLADLLVALHDVESLQRIRFLTSHPNYITDRLLDSVATLPKVCEHLEVPVQAGDDAVLKRMRRGYTIDQYRRLMDSIRERVPGVAIVTDVIVGFPGESPQQFGGTYKLLEELRFDMMHIAAYSPRPGTVAARLADDVPSEEKERRRKAIEQLHKRIAGEINAELVGKRVEVLVEEKHKGRWKGRTRTNKLVFFEDERDWRGRLAPVEITWAGPWSMLGRVVK